MSARYGNWVSSRGLAEDRVDILHVMTVPMSLRFLRGQAQFMNMRGFRIAVACSPGEGLERFGREEGIATFPVDMRRAITPVRDFMSLVRLVRILLWKRPAIVHSHTPKGGLLGMLAAWVARIPIRVYHMRGLPLVTAYGWRRRVLQLSERTSCRLANRVICVSSSLRCLAVQQRLCPPEKIVVLANGSGNGVDAEGEFDPARWGGAMRRILRLQYGIPPDVLLVLFVGRIARDKGIVELAEAWASIRDGHQDTHLMFVGPSEEADASLGEGVGALYRDPRVQFAGMHQSSAPFYGAADLVVLPTYREGFPNVILEAGAMGLPVVCTRVPGCEDAVVEGQTGTMVPPRDARALASAIERYLRDPELRQRHGAAGRRRVLELYRPSLVWDALYAEYSSLLRAAGTSFAWRDVDEHPMENVSDG